MFTCKIENTKHNVLTLTQEEALFQLIKIEGLNPPKSQINVSNVAGLDGAKFNSSKLETRNIVLTIKLNGDVEKNRLTLYSFFRSKQWCKFYYKNESRNVYIEGYTENVECDLFTNKEIMQVSIICPQPYFKQIEEIITDVSKSLAAFNFPFSINTNEPIPVSTYNSSRITEITNDSEVETGVNIEIDVLGSCDKIKLNNIVTGETFTLNYNFLENDVIKISTYKGEKSVNLIRETQEINLFTALEKGSTFFQLDIGENYFSYLINNGSKDEMVRIKFKYSRLYGGV